MNETPRASRRPPRNGQEVRRNKRRSLIPACSVTRRPIKQVPGFKGFPTTVIVDRAGKVRLLVTENIAQNAGTDHDAVRVLLAEPVPTQAQPRAQKPRQNGRLTASAARVHTGRHWPTVIGLSLGMGRQSSTVQRRGGVTSNRPVGGLNRTPTFQSWSGWCLASRYFITTSSDGGIPGS